MHSTWAAAVLALLPVAFADPKAATTLAKSATSTCTQTICADYINSCGQMYGGCYPACKGYTTPKFKDPGCPTTTLKPTKISTSRITTTSCPFVCKDYFDKCGNTYGPGCFSSCTGQADPSYTTPSCVPTSSIPVSTITPTKKPCAGVTVSMTIQPVSTKS